VTLFVPGLYTSPSDLAKRLGSGLRIGDAGTSLAGERLPFSVGLDWEDNPGDGSFGEAFSFGTCSPSEMASIDAAGGAVVLQVPAELHTHHAAIATLAEALCAAGALAFRIEQSKLGFVANAWLEQVSSGDPAALYRLAAVTLRGERSTRTLGMHVFSLADVEIALAGREASRWLDTMALYQIEEDPVFASGHTFAPDAETARRIVEWWPDTGYPSDHPCHNPFGVFQLGPPVAKGRAQPQLRMTFVPALRVLLEAARNQKGSPLEPAEIERLRDRGACIAMDPRDARELERVRGYADIDAERAVECWAAIEAAGIPASAAPSR